jgi:type VI secretion system ImpM family protein
VVLATPFVFGKVPDRGDFVRAGRQGPLVDDLDDWLQRGLLALRQPIEGAPTVAFVLVRPSGTLMGAFHPSHDRAGRVFPLAVGGALDSTVAMDGSQIASRGSFLGAAAVLCGEIVRGLAPEEALPRLQVPPAPGDYSQKAPLDVFGDVAIDPVLSQLAEGLGAFRQADAPRYGLGLPMPPEPALRASAAAFWLDAVSARIPRRSATTALWTVTDDPARFVLFAGVPTPDALAYLLLGADTDGVYVVELPNHVAATCAAPTLRALVARS